MSKRKASPKPTSTSTGKTVKKLRPQDFSSSLMSRLQPQMRPTDFGQEIADLNFSLDPSLVQEQAGEYMDKTIGTFGSADPSHKVASAAAGGEHPASHQIAKPASHQKEGETGMERAGLAGVNAVDTGSADEYGTDDELTDIFNRLGVSGHADGHGHFVGYTPKENEGRGVDVKSLIDDDDDIEWDKIDWGSFTKQFNRFKQTHTGGKISDLEDFAKLILKNPEKYASKTLKRARFYLNVILPKSKR